MKKLALGFALATMMIPAFAAAEWNGHDLTVTDLVSYDSGTTPYITVRFSSATSATPFGASPCSAGQGQWYLGGTLANQERMLSLLTAAHLSQRTVRILRSGMACTGGGTAGYPLITGIDLGSNP